MSPLARRWLRRLGLVVVGCGAALVAGECAVRVFVAFGRPLLTQPDELLGWRHVPGVRRPVDGGEIVINRFGNRGPAHEVARTPGSFRVMVLGDSFTEGLQVGEEQLFTHLLERSGEDLEVINTGVGSYGTVQQTLYFEHEGARFRPDLVIVAVFVNDLNDNIMPISPGVGPRPYVTLEDDEVVIRPELRYDMYLEYCLPLPGAGFLRANSYLYRAMNVAWQAMRADAMRERRFEDIKRLHPGLFGKMNMMVSVLERLRASVQGAGGDLAVVLLPSREAMKRPSDDWQTFQGKCEERDLRVVSLWSALSAADREGQQIYFDHDIHFTATGHRLVAEQLAALVAAVR